VIWHEAETRCGVGSTLDMTRSLRAWLPDALARHGVAKLLDAPCGDRHWMRCLDLPCDYVGVDHEPEHVRKASEDGTDVRLADLRTDHLPKADAILARDFFQHLSMADADAALANMRETGARLLFTTCHGKAGADIETGANSFRFVDMRGTWGAPIDSVEDGGKGRILGVWPL
jgi:hypothetical protein